MIDKIMLPEYQRIAIFESIGWYKTVASGVWAKSNGEGQKSSLAKFEDIPDYLNDLNAMHEVEEILTYDQQLLYVRHIANPWDTDPNGNYWKMWLCAKATAAQRAEAYLKTLNLWKD